MQYLDELDDAEETHDDAIETWRHRVTIPVLVTLLVLSLLLHALTLGSLFRVRSVAVGQLNAFIKYTEQVQQDTIQVDIPIKQSIPIQASIPFNKKLTVPIKTTLPISDTINVTTPLGELPLPVQMTFPIDLEVPIEVNQTLDVSTTVDIDLNVPIVVPVKETPLASYLDELQRALRELAASL